MMADELETMKLIEKIVAQHFEVKVEDMKSRDRSRDVTDARHFFWYILHYITGFQTPVIAEYSERVRRNIQYGVSVVKNGLKNQSFYRKHLQDIQEEIRKINIL